MEHKLCEAAIKGDIDSLDAIIQKDPLILHKFADGCFNGAASPLHVATSNNQTHFVEELLHRQPELTEVLDSQLRSALHLASAKGHDKIVETLLNLKPELKLRLTEVLDSQQRSALHLASAMGHHQIVKVLVKANPKMCLVRDREGKNPLHVAAMEGKINALEELVGACPQAARERVDRNETILHLCVKHKQLESLMKLLEMIKGCNFVNAKDSDGNTILHLAILYEHFEIADYVLWMETKDVNATNGCGATIEKSLQKITHLLGKGTNEEKETIDVNATNASGHTAMDILLLGSGNKEKSDRGRDHGRDHVHDVNATNASRHTAMDILFLGSGNKEESDRGRVHVPDLLLKANAKQAKDLVGGDWLTNKRESLMVVASLIATMAFQAGVSPPGGVWQDNKEGHKAGEAVMAYNNTYYYKFFLRCNTIGFVASLSTILLLVSGLKFRNKAMMWILIVTMWLAITSMAITYALSNHVVTPSDNLSSLSNANKIGLIVWSSVMALLLVKHTFGLVAFFAKEVRRKKKAIKRMMNRPSSLRNFIGGKDGRASSPLPLKS